MHCGGRRRRARHFEPRIGLAFARRALGPERVERRLLLWRRLLRRLADLARTEQEIEPRLPGLDGSRTRRSRHRLDLRRRLDMMRGVLAVGRQRHRLLLGLRHGLVRPRDARAQAFDGRCRHLDGRARRGRSRDRHRGRRWLQLVNDFLNGLAGDRLGRRCRQLDPRRTRGGGLCGKLGSLQRGRNPRQLGHHRRQADQQKPADHRKGARQNQRAAQAQLFDRDAESDQCSACGSQQYTQH